MTTEAEVTRIVLQQGQSLQLGKRTYTIAPPCLATIMLIAQELSNLKHTPIISTDVRQINDYAHRSALEMRTYARIIAIVILGKRAFKPTIWDNIKGFFKYSAIDVLTDDILAELNGEQLKDIVSQLLIYNKVDFFYGAIISLPASNILKQTKSEEMIATASGHSSVGVAKD